MEKVSRNEIVTLRHLSEGNNSQELPKGLTVAQYLTALERLHNIGMVKAAFSNGYIYSAVILMSGQAVLDDIKDKENLILSNLLLKRNLTLGQYELLELTDKEGVSHSNGQYAQSHFGMNPTDFKKEVWGPLMVSNYLRHDDDKKGMVLSNEGAWMLQGIKNDLNSQLANDYIDIPVKQSPTDNTKSEISSTIEDSGLRIQEKRISDVIKIIKSMHDVGLFVDQNGNKPTLKSVMDEFGNFLKADQFLQYSTYLNKALQAKENTFMEIFYQMEKSAEKYYKETKIRKISK